MQKQLLPSLSIFTPRLTPFDPPRTLLKDMDADVRREVQGLAEAVLTDSYLERCYESVVARRGRLAADEASDFLWCVVNDVAQREVQTLRACGIPRKVFLRYVEAYANAWLGPRLMPV